MARRKNGGGRVTPKGAKPSSGFATLVDLPPELDELLPRFDDRAAVLRDWKATSFIALFESAFPSNVVELREPDESRLQAGDVLAALAVFGPRPPQRVVDTIAAFAEFGGQSAPQARAILESFTVKPSKATAVFGQGAVGDTYRIDDIFGEVTQYLFVVAYPDGSRGAAAVFIDTLSGGFIQDAMVLEAPGDFLTMTEESPELTIVKCPAGEAAAAIDEAFQMNDITVDIEDDIEEGVGHTRPFLERLLADVPRQPLDSQPVSADERNRLVNEFTIWADAHHPELDDETVSWASLAIDFAVDYASGDPLKWGPNTAISFLERSAHKVLASPEELLEIPVMLRAFIEWAHERSGWGTTYLGDTLDAIDDVMDLFEGTIEDPDLEDSARSILGQIFHDIDLDDPKALAAAVEQYNTSLLPEQLTEPPHNGSHPEPFETTGLGAQTDRVAEIAELASVAARAIFDDEYVTLVRRLAWSAGLTDPSLFARGKPDIWASGLVYAVAQLNRIIGGWGPMVMDADELTDRLAGSAGTIVAKAKAIRDAAREDIWSSNPRYQHSNATIDFASLGLNIGSLHNLGVEVGGSDHGLFGDEFEDSAPAALAPTYERLPDGSSFELRCELRYTDAWRTFTIPAAVTLLDLHAVLQRAFGWYDDHLHEFSVGRRRYGQDDPFLGSDDPSVIDEDSVRLDELVRPGSSIEYTYDFGDDWRVLVKVVRVLDPDPQRDQVNLIDGAGDAPPEDCGGPGGFQNLIEVLSNPKHPEYAELREWSGDFRPGSFDLTAAAAHLRME